MIDFPFSHLYNVCINIREVIIMANSLVAYFSATGTTKKVAEALAEAIGADIYEIEPEVLYTAEDLDWQDLSSRSSVEMNDPKSRPALEGKADNIDEYDRIFVGFPIWWYTAPRIINSFLEQQDLSGKVIIPFATSGSSEMGDTNLSLAPSCEGADLKEGKRFPADVSVEALKVWADEI